MRNRGLVRLFLRGVGASILAIGGCSSSDNVTGPPSGPPDASEISGAWNGTFSPADFADCDSGTPARADFQRNGETVTGTLSATENGCGFEGVTFQGTLRGSSLSGTVVGGRFRDGTASGVFTGSRLEITLTSTCPGALCIPGGQMSLRR